MQKIVKVGCFAFRKLSVQDVFALQVMVGQRVGVWISVCWAVVDRTRKGYKASCSRKCQMCRRIGHQSTIPGIWDSVLQSYEIERGGELYVKIHKLVWNTWNGIKFWQYSDRLSLRLSGRWKRESCKGPASFLWQRLEQRQEGSRRSNRGCQQSFWFIVRHFHIDFRHIDTGSGLHSGLI